MENKVPPQYLEAEKSVLGGVMLESDAWDVVSEILTEDDFYKPAHRKIFGAIRNLRMQAQPSDILTVSDQLLKLGDLELVGGPAYLAELVEETLSTANIESYARMIKDKSLLRSMIQVCHGVIDRAYDQSFQDIDAFMDSVETDIFRVANNRTTQDLTAVGDLVKLGLEKLEQLYSQRGEVTGVSTGFLDLDRMTAGFQPGEMTIIAARPSMGKTAFSLNVALHAALRAQKKVAYFSVEMAKEQVLTRMLASEARIGLSELRTGSLTDSAWPRLIETASKLSETLMFIDDTSGLSPFEIRTKCRRMKAKVGLDLIMIDYLQLMQLKQKTDNREREVSEISRLLKAIAKELSVPVVALAQLNRGVEGRSDRRPMLSDLRESGSIEQDADVIMMLYREDYYDRENPDVRGLAEVIVGKQRNGPTGVVKLQWKPQFGIFEENKEHQPPAAPMPNAPPGNQPPQRPSGPPKNFAPSF